MKYHELIKVLRLCPFSDVFGMPLDVLNKNTVTKKQARALVLQISRKTSPGQHMSVIYEADLELEKASLDLKIEFETVKAQV